MGRPEIRRGAVTTVAVPLVGYPRATGLVLGFVADRLFADPRRFHPVAGFGQISNLLERHLYGDSRLRGMIHGSVLAGAAVALGVLAERRFASPAARLGVTAVATWVVLGGRSLEREAASVQTCLDRGDLSAARSAVATLVGRETSSLDVAGVSRAAIESVAENTVDAVVAPLVWGAISGIPGLLGYRAINTLDAMLGHRSARYEHYGWFCARVDDLVNLPASRLTGLLTLVARPDRARMAWRVWRRDAAAHPSPNGGVAESAFAGALGVRLGGTNRYDGNRVEHRGLLGDGRGAEPRDIGAANVLARRVSRGALVMAALAVVTMGRHCVNSGQQEHHPHS